VLNEVRYGGVAERLEIREDTRGLGQREREREAREEVRVVGGGSCVDCSEGRDLESDGEKLCTNSSTPKPRNPKPRNPQFNGQC
jgi:hypothetical protein